MRGSKRLGLGSVILVFTIGLLSGIQCALYMFDRFDDGTADDRSLLIGIGFVLFGIGYIAWLFRRTDPR
ncbi:MAG: hypothetical protein KJO98_09715 [Rhodothermia bacterium]|nr:hypothetical protein [Rhodothermia bacterium]